MKQRKEQPAKQTKQRKRAAVKRRRLWGRAPFAERLAVSVRKTVFNVGTPRKATAFQERLKIVAIIPGISVPGKKETRIQRSFWRKACEIRDFRLFFKHSTAHKTSTGCFLDDGSRLKGRTLKWELLLMTIEGSARSSSSSNVPVQVSAAGQRKDGRSQRGVLDGRRL